MCVFVSDRAAQDQPEVVPGQVESVQTSVWRDQWLPDGGTLLCVPLPSAHGISGGFTAAGGEFTGKSTSCLSITL